MNYLKLIFDKFIKFLKLKFFKLKIKISYILAILVFSPGFVTVLFWFFAFFMLNIWKFSLFLIEYFDYDQSFDFLIERFLNKDFFSDVSVFGADRVELNLTTALRLMHMRSMIVDVEDVAYFDFFYKNYFYGISLDEALANYNDIISLKGKVYTGDKLFIRKQEIDLMLRPEVFLNKKVIISNDMPPLDISPEDIKKHINKGFISAYLQYDTIILKNKQWVYNYYIYTGMIRKDPTEFTMDEMRDLTNGLIVQTHYSYKSWPHDMSGEIYFWLEQKELDAMEKKI